MKSALISSVAVATAAAFSSNSAGHAGRPSALYGSSRPDASEAIAEALRISKEFGPTSKEARVAWDNVEEMDSNDSSPAFGAAPAINAATDYSDQIRALSFLVDETKERLSQMRVLANQLKELELTDPSLTKLGSDADGIRSALAEAKAASDVHGPHSPEADAAWAALERCADDDECSVDSHYRYSAAALKAHHTYDAVVDADLLNNAIDALDTVEELGRFVQVERNRLKSMST